MLKTTCQDIYVKFNVGNGQHISFRDGPTTSQKLLVIDDSLRLEILYLDNNSSVVKTIVFPMKDVKEYSCEYISGYERAQ